MNTSSLNEPILSVKNINVAFKNSYILKNLSLDINAKEILGFIGPSGAGKSVLMRTILGLIQKESGTIKFLGKNINALPEREQNKIKTKMGVLFQQGALFSSLTVLENIQLPMRQHLELSENVLNELAYLKLVLVGLDKNSADKYPSELSGGMIKRVALARALSLDPQMLFLDEPTSGLDPIGAADFDQLILNLRNTLGITVYMITHDLDSLYTICDRVAILGDKKIKAHGNLDMLEKNLDPWIQSYFHGKRARQMLKTK